MIVNVVAYYVKMLDLHTARVATVKVKVNYPSTLSQPAVRDEISGDASKST